MSQSEVDMTQVFQRMRQAVDQLSQAWATAARSIADSMPEPVKADQPDLFEHTDDDGDQAVVEEHHLSGWLRMSVDSSVAHLSPDAVNRLAQYLDWYRTDQTECDVELAEQCGRANPFRVTGYTSGAPVTYPLPTGFDRCTGTYEGFRCRRSVNHEGEHA